MALITSKSRYKEFGLTYNREYASDDRSESSLPARSRLVAFTRPTSFASTSRTRTHIVREGQTLHHLALHYFGDARLWWFISDYNGGITSVSPEQEVVIPSQADVSQY